MFRQKVFVQFKYCPLCRINHKKAKKHVHSKRHQQIVANVLAKFLTKLKEAKATLENPMVKDTTWSERDAMFWCYFCALDVAKHCRKQMLSADCFLVHGGMLEHIVRSDHAENTAKFLKENGVDMKRTPEFILSNQSYLSYLERTEAACTQFLAEKSQELQQLASGIRAQDVYRQALVGWSQVEQRFQSQPIDSKKGQVVSHTGRSTKAALEDEDAGPRKTIQAFGPGLTPVDRSHEDDSLGNIYTDAVPPWLRSESRSEDSKSKVIGPTVADLEKHRKLQRKAQLPPERVGAKFDHKSDCPETWLPSFGGVWSKGGRTKSAQQFRRRQAKKKPFGSTSSSLPLQSTSQLSKLVDPSHGPGTSGSQDSVQINHAVKSQLEIDPLHKESVNQKPNTNTTAYQFDCHSRKSNDVCDLQSISDPSMGSVNHGQAFAASHQIVNSYHESQSMVSRCNTFRSATSQSHDVAQGRKAMTFGSTPGSQVDVDGSYLSTSHHVYGNGLIPPTLSVSSRAVETVSTQNYMPVTESCDVVGNNHRWTPYRRKNMRESVKVDETFDSDVNVTNAIRLISTPVLKHKDKRK